MSEKLTKEELQHQFDQMMTAHANKRAFDHDRKHRELIRSFYPYLPEQGVAIPEEYIEADYALAGV